MNCHHVFSVALGLASTLAIGSAANAQTPNPELNNLLQQAYGIVNSSQQGLNQFNAQLRQQEALLQHSCYQLGNTQDCVVLQQFYQSLIPGYNAGIDYYKGLQQNGWADSFGTFGN